MTTPFNLPAYEPIAAPEDMHRLLRYNGALVYESAGNPIAPVLDMAMAGYTHIASQLHSLTTAFTGVFSKRIDNLELGFSPTGTMAVLRKVNYTDMMEMEAYVPPGLTAGWVPYLDALCLAANLIKDAEEDFLRPYQVFVTETLGKPNQMGIVGFTGKTKDFTKRREELIKLTADLFTSKEKGGANPEAITTTWSKVVGNNSEFDGVCARCNGLIKLLNEVRRDKLKDNADKVSRVIHGLMRPAPTAYSSKTLQDVAEGGVEYVSILEFYAVTHYRALTLLAAIKRTAEHINATLKD